MPKKKEGRAKALLSSRKSEDQVLYAALLVMLIAIVVFILDYTLDISVIESQRATAKYTLDQYVTLNAIDIHNTVKQTRTETAEINSEGFLQTYGLLNGLDEVSGTNFAHLDEDGNANYYIRNVRLEAINPTTDCQLRLTYDLGIYLRFAGGTYSVTWVPVSIKSDFLPKA